MSQKTNDIKITLLFTFFNEFNELWTETKSNLMMFRLWRNNFFSLFSKDFSIFFYLEIFFFFFYFHLNSFLYYFGNAWIFFFKVLNLCFDILAKCGVSFFCELFSFPLNWKRFEKFLSRLGFYFRLFFYFNWNRKIILHIYFFLLI